jgi:two-component system response regulator YesN
MYWFFNPFIANGKEVGMLKVFFADDEREVLEGIKNIVDWKGIGYEICGEAMDGLSAYDLIRQLNPDLILIDIKMPKLQGIDLSKQLRDFGYKGHIIVLSGYSEFKYAQAAICNGVDYYLTKPIDEEVLTEAAISIRQKILAHHMTQETTSYYKEKAKHKILDDILFDAKLQKMPYSLKEMNLEADCYQVLLLEGANRHSNGHNELLRRLKLPSNTLFVDILKHEQYKVVLLKGTSVIQRFESMSHEQIEDTFPFVLCIGPVVKQISEAHFSLRVAQKIHSRIFFLGGKSPLMTEAMLKNETCGEVFAVSDSRILGQQLYDLLVVFRKTECLSFLNDLADKMMYAQNDADDIRSVLVGMYIFLASKLKTSYVMEDLKFMTNAEIIKSVHSLDYLHEIIDFFKHEIHRVHQLIGGLSSEGILDGIIEYIKHNYHEDIKLKILAPKFGYNSSYLGKIFAKKMEISFNDYLHKVRIDEAKRLLLQSTYKIYEIATLLGYKNVDYFHLRFKQFEQTTPNDYRSSHHIDIKE